MNKKAHPISNITWVNVNKLKANNYNPNHVLKQEMKLLELSLLKQGWIQPILCDENFIIIDGFHRATLTKTSRKVYELTNGEVPVVILRMTPPERMLLTIRINRAKGSHISFKMSEVIHKLINEYHIPQKVIAKEIGATPREVELLSKDNVFQFHELTEESKYNQAWIPKPKQE